MNTPEVVTEEKTAVASEAKAEEATKPVETPVAQPPEAGEAKVKNWATKRVDELTRDWRQAERERDQLRQELERVRQQPVPVQIQGKPTPEQFPDYNQYVEALTDWKVGQAQKNVQESFERQRQVEQETQLVRNFEESEDTARGLYEDYDVVTRNPELKVTTSMIDTLSGFEMGPEVLYYLGKHADEAARIARLPPKQEAAALARIEARLERLSQQAPTTAPPPPSTVKGSASVEKKPEQMTDKEYWEWDKKQNAKRRRG